MTEKVTQMDSAAKPATQTVNCAIVPMELMSDIQDVLKEAPFKLAKPVLEKLSTVPVQPVEVRPPND